MRKIDYPLEIEKISTFLADYLMSSMLKKYIIGISGGIDSALAAALAVKAIGKENVIGVMMPYKSSHPESLSDGRLLCEQLGIRHHTVDISPMVDAWFDTFHNDASVLRRGNWMARIRMCVLYDLSAKYHALVLGTSNLSELMTGYFTQHGDSAAAVEPLGRLYKTEVKAMSQLLRLPDRIINKAPTADLWEKQTDESEMGISYAMLDEILWAIDSMADLESFDDKLVKKVYTMIAKSTFKRVPAPMPEAPCSS
jgi:NAD+ synthase